MAKNLNFTSNENFSNEGALQTSTTDIIKRLMKRQVNAVSNLKIKKKSFEDYNAKQRRAWSNFRNEGEQPTTEIHEKNSNTTMFAGTQRLKSSDKIDTTSEALFTANEAASEMISPSVNGNRFFKTKFSAGLPIIASKSVVNRTRFTEDGGFRQKKVLKVDNLIRRKRRDYSEEKSPI